MYYVCTYDDYKPVRGPFRWPKQAASEVMNQADPTRFCTMSRYMLAKFGIYPNTQAGDAKLLADLSSAKMNDI